MYEKAFGQCIIITAKASNFLTVMLGLASLVIFMDVMVRFKENVLERKFKSRICQ